MREEIEPIFTGAELEMLLSKTETSICPASTLDPRYFQCDVFFAV